MRASELGRECGQFFAVFGSQPSAPEGSKLTITNHTRSTGWVRVICSLSYKGAGHRRRTGRSSRVRNGSALLTWRASRPKARKRTSRRRLRGSRKGSPKGEGAKLRCHSAFSADCWRITAPQRLRFDPSQRQSGASRARPRDWLRSRQAAEAGPRPSSVLPFRRYSGSSQDCRVLRALLASAL